jgi:predicted DNA binding CopG/RHH family protein
MRKHYDFSKMKARRNPYVKLLKQSVTIRLDKETVEYFKSLAVKTGVPYQHLINLYLRDCVLRQKELTMRWAVNGHRTPRAAAGRRT